MEADGGVSSPPHRRGIQGTGQPADTSHGATEEEAQMRSLSFMYLRSFCIHTENFISDQFFNIRGHIMMKTPHALVTKDLQISLKMQESMLSCELLA